MEGFERELRSEARERGARSRNIEGNMVVILYGWTGSGMKFEVVCMVSYTYAGRYA